MEREWAGSGQGKYEKTAGIGHTCEREMVNQEKHIMAHGLPRDTDWLAVNRWKRVRQRARAASRRRGPLAARRRQGCT